MHPTVTAPLASRRATPGGGARTRTLCGALGAVLLLAACAEQPRPAPIVYRGTDPAGATTAQPSAQPPAAAAPAATVDGRGVVDYGGFSAVVARPGDSVASMAARVGISESALASYNGLPASHTPRAGDELILPPEATIPQTARIETTPLPAPDAQPPAVAPAAETAAPAFDLASIEAALEPETPPAAPTAAPETTPAPAATPTPEARFEPAPDPVAPSGPPSGAAPAPAAQETAALTPPPPPAPPAPAASAAVFAAPVDGPITRRFNAGGSGPRSDGVAFAAPAGATVAAAGDGQVALISESLGGLGTIVLIRHQGELLTVYGRVQDVVVAKGDRVTRGQPIGAVAPAPDGGDASLHFEVRRGAQSVDPEEFLAG